MFMLCETGEPLGLIGRPADGAKVPVWLISPVDIPAPDLVAEPLVMLWVILDGAWLLDLAVEDAAILCALLGGFDTNKDGRGS